MKPIPAIVVNGRLTFGTPRDPKRPRWSRQFCPELGITPRSHWEQNYAYYLNWLIQQHQIVSWKYEPKTFWFEKIKRGCRSYLPDFEVTLLDGSIVYHEVKGWQKQRGMTALKRIKKYYPNVKIELIDAPRYRAIARTAGKLIPGWQ